MGIALFGGSFDPFHVGHLGFATEALKLDSVKEVYFIPAFVSPFKEGSHSGASPDDRLEMVSSAVKGYQHFKVLDLEIRRGGKSFTIDTVKEIIDFFPEEEISIMLGEDAFIDIEKWYKSDELLRMVDLIVMLRSGSDAIRSMGSLDSSSGFCYDRNSNEITSTYGHDVSLIRENISNISSSDIRNKVGSGESIEDLVPSTVASFIENNNIYK